MEKMKPNIRLRWMRLMTTEIKPLDFIHCVHLPDHQIARYVRNAKYPRFCASTTSAILTSLLFILVIVINALTFYENLSMESFYNLIAVICYAIFTKCTMSDYFVYKSYGVKNSYQFCQLNQFRINFY